MPRISKKTITGRRERQQHRRNQAATLFAQGMTRSEVAKKLKVTWRAAHEWFKAWKAGGESALKTKGKPGPRPKVTEAAQIEQLRQQLLQGPRSTWLRQRSPDDPAHQPPDQAEAGV
jgi:transposase